MKITDVFKNVLPEDMSDEQIKQYIEEQRAIRDKFLKPKKKKASSSEKETKDAEV